MGGSYRRLLVAVDASESGSNAFRQACRLGGGEARIAAITAIPVYPDQFDVLATKERVGEALRREGERILSEVEKVAREEGVDVKLILEEGSPFERIVDVAEEGGYDLIVMGRRGKSRIEKALVGSVTSRVIGHSQRDVMVVPSGASIGWKTILLATDGSRFSQAATERAIGFAKSKGGKLKVLNAVDPMEGFSVEEVPNIEEDLLKRAGEVIRRVQEDARQAGVESESHIEKAEPYKLITEAAAAQGAGIIFMGTHGRTGLRRLLMGSVTEKVIGHASCPVLVVKF